MSKIKYALAAGGLSAALTLGLAAPVAAQSNNQSGTNVGDGNISQTQNLDDSVHIDRSRTVNGNCSAILDQDVDQEAKNKVDDVEAGNEGDTENSVEGALNAVDDQNLNQTNSASNSQSNSQSASQSFSADCSVTNVHQAAAAAAQVQAPAGGVKAGAGGADSSILSLLGFNGSLASAGYGLLRLRRRGL